MIVQDNAIKSPCVRKCTLNDDNICIGCYRSLDEIYKWGKADIELRKNILRNIEYRLNEACCAVA